MDTRVRLASRLPPACVLVAAWLATACAGQRGARAPPARSLIHAALMELASTTEPEAPRALLAWLPRGRDPACGDARDEPARMRCHLRRARVRVVGGGDRGPWRVVVELPALSDHIHVVEVRASGGALEVVRVESAN